MGEESMRVMSEVSLSSTEPAVCRRDPGPQPVPSLEMNFPVSLDTQNVLFSTAYQTTESDSDDTKRNAYRS